MYREEVGRLTADDPVATPSCLILCLRYEGRILYRYTYWTQGNGGFHGAVEFSDSRVYVCDHADGSDNVVLMFLEPEKTTWKGAPGISHARHHPLRLAEPDLELYIEILGLATGPVRMICKES
jgi:hypothetical protein